MKTTVNLNPTQYKFLISPKKFTFFTGGYKAGKTFILIRKAFYVLTKTRQTGLLASPTYRMNSDLLQPEIERFFTSIGLEYYWWSSKSLYETLYGRILIRTLEKRSSLEGHNIGWFGVDEIDLMRRDKADENWRVLLSKLTKGSRQYGFGAGTNEGFSFIYNKFVEEGGSNYELFQASTMENRHNLPAGYVEMLRSNFDSVLAQRYVDGKFVNVNDLPAYYSFSRENVYSDKIDISRESELYIGADFNVNPMAWVVGVKRSGVLMIFDEIIINNANTKKTCDMVSRKYKGYRIRIYPDMTGNSRKTSASFTDIQILRMSGFKVYGYSNSRVRDRLNIVNNCLEKRQVMIYSGCRNLIRDLEQVSKDGYGEIDKSDPQLSHSSDALGYLLCRLFPFKKHFGVY